MPRKPRTAEEKKNRDYTQDTKYESAPEQRAKRSNRNKARREVEARGGKKLSPTQEVDHKNANALDNSSKNLQVLSRRANRVKGHHPAK